MTDSTKQILRVQNIHTYYGLSHILFGISLEINEGEVLCLLGRNGAGENHHHAKHRRFHPGKRGKGIFLW